MVCEMYDGSRESDGRCGSVYEPLIGPPRREPSSDWRAGVEVPEADTEGCLLRFPRSPAAAARSAEACETPAAGTPAVLPVGA